MTADLDDVDRLLLDRLQDGLPIVSRPYATLSVETGLEENEIVARIGRMLESGVLSRFGPMFNADRMGGSFCLCAMAVPEERFDEVAAIVNDFTEVAHNYAREHRFNMWFVLAVGAEKDIVPVVERIERATGLEVLSFPKEAEYFIGLKVPG